MFREQPGNPKKTPSEPHGNFAVPMELTDPLKSRSQKEPKTHPGFLLGPRGFPSCRKSAINDSVRVALKQLRCVASLQTPTLLETSEHNAATPPADADLHALPAHRRDALHQMRRADETHAYRAAKPEFRSADLSVRTVRHRRMLPEGDVSIGLSQTSRHQALFTA